MSGEPIDNWADTKEVQEYLRVEHEMISEWISRRGRPACKIDGFEGFNISIIDEWIRSGEADDSHLSKEDTNA